VPAPPPRAALRPGALKPAYLFHGPSLFEARAFIDEARAAQAESASEEAVIERFDLETTSWREALDAARTAGLFFAPWRFVIVEGAAAAPPSAGEAASLREYLAAPTERTVLVVLHEGKLAKTCPLAKAFASPPEASASVVELAPLKGERLIEWVDGRLARIGKRAGTDAVERLLDAAGNDLDRLDREIEKLAAFVGERRTIEPDDVDRLAGAGRAVETWELTAALEQSDAGLALAVLAAQMEKGTRAEYLLSVISGLVRDLLLAQEGTRAGRDRREIFREIRPQQAHWDFIRKRLFDLADRIPGPALRGLVADLGRVDLMLKSTDADPRALLEAFCCEFVRAAGGKGAATSRPRG